MVSRHADTVRPEFDPRTETYTVNHDPDSGRAATTTLVHSLSSLTGDDPREMRPLGFVVDTEALDAHVRSRSETATLSFEFHGHRVTVRGDGRIEFAPLQDTDDRLSRVRA